jgi:hypothetical protein
LLEMVTRLGKDKFELSPAFGGGIFRANKLLSFFVGAMFLLVAGRTDAACHGDNECEPNSICFRENCTREQHDSLEMANFSLDEREDSIRLGRTKSVKPLGTWGISLTAVGLATIVATPITYYATDSDEAGYAMGIAGFGLVAIGSHLGLGARGKQLGATGHSSGEIKLHKVFRVLIPFALTASGATMGLALVSEVLLIPSVALLTCAGVMGLVSAGKAIGAVSHRERRRTASVVNLSPVAAPIAKGKGGIVGVAGFF